MTMDAMDAMDAMDDRDTKPNAQDAAGAAPTEAADTAAGPQDSAATLRALQERVAELERELASERERATDYMQRWQRAQADHANFRRRAQTEQEQFAALAAAQTMALVLPALDSLERAFKLLPESLRQLTWIDGIALVELQLRRALEAHGLKPFEPQPGEPLDFARHQAIAETPTAEHPEGTIVEVVQRGYELEGRPLRPALVRVARRPESAPDGGTTSGSGPPESSAAAANDGGP
jgi:molecular chaperone GrpE